MRARWKTLLNLVISAGLLVFLLVTIDWSEMLAAARSVRPMLLIASYAVFLFGGVLLALRLQALLRPSPLRSSWPRLLMVWLRSAFYSMFLPSDVGAAVARWYMVTGNRQGRRFFVFVTALERLMLISGSLLLTIVPLWLVRDERLLEFRSTALPILVLLLILCLVTWSLFVTPCYQWFAGLCRWCRSHCRPAWLAEAFAVDEDFEVYRRHPGALLKALGIHFVFQAVLFLRVLLLFAALRVELSLAAVLWMSMLVILLTTIPLSFAGFGVRELGFAWLAGLQGLGAETGALIGAMLSIQVAITAVLGGLVNLSAAAERPAGTAACSEEKGPGGSPSCNERRVQVAPVSCGGSEP
jgi:uncharacterized membrane protein YbhN (UPF0104 family)